MVKFFGGTKKKSASVTPLMDDEEPSSSSSSGLARREKIKKERDERRAKRDKRHDDGDAARKNNKKKSNKPKVSQHEQDLKDAKLGCCHRFGQFLVKTIHFIDALIGSFFITYGFVIYYKFIDNNPAMEAVITSLVFGWYLLLTSLLGIIGFTTRVCKRCGIAFSAYMAPFIALFYIFVIIALLSSPEKVFDYMTKHKDVLFLNDAEIETIRRLVPVWCIVLACLAAIELSRFVIMRKLRDKLLRYDAASGRIASSSERSSSSSKRGGSKRSNKSGSTRSYSYDDDVTEPLLGSDESV